MSSYAMIPGVSEEDMARAMNPATPDPEPDIEVHDGVARRPKVQRRKTAAEAED
jgi:hypothetical protein